MTAASRQREYVRRVTVESVRNDEPDALAASAAALRARVPPDRVDHFDGRSLRYRRDTPLALAVVAVCTLALGLLGHAISARIGHPGVASRALAFVLDAAAIASGWLFIAAMAWRAELSSASGALHFRVRVAFVWRTLPAVSADDVTAALVLDHPRRVVLVGPRNAELLEVFRERWLDPPALSDWMADAAVLIASTVARESRR